ncbi:MAG: twin-arginine translocase TatA/TatE family subunit [Phycisphaeraceae bacterium]|nr:MAG: twin-arginine translocase TatA/TatE family subunit [Phycisphaeraceae bacterium]
MPGGWEWLIIGAIGLLLFGRRLPEVGRSLGKGIVEFKKGLKDIQDEVETAGDDKKQVEGASSGAKPSLREPEQWSENERRVSHGEAEPAPQSSSEQPRPASG